MPAPASVDEYLKGLPKPSRAALEKLRKTIKAAAPNATDAISYQMPAFKVDGRPLVAYAAFKDHCSLFPMSMKVIEDHRNELEPYLSGKGTVRFDMDEPLPAGLVKKIIKARIAEIGARHRR